MVQSKKPIKTGESMDKLELANTASEAVTASKMTLYAGGATSAVAWWQTIDWLAVGGIFLAIAGFLMNFYFSYQKNRREQLEHELRMKGYSNKKEDLKYEFEAKN